MALRTRPSHRLGKRLALSAIGALTLGPGAAQAPASPSLHTPTRPTAIPESDPVATTAREVDLQETGYLHAVGEPGDTILEQGHATGTYDCAITVHLTIESGGKATAAFTVKPRGGSVTGTGTARFAQQGADGYFGGTLAIGHGTGSYAHASGTNIGISGVVNRETFALTVHVHGKISV
jgi:hypothetical protein